MGTGQLIGTTELGSREATFGALVDYRKCAHAPLQERLRLAVNKRCAIAIAGPAHSICLEQLRMARTLPGIEDPEEYTSHLFAVTRTEICRHPWIGLRSPTTVADTVNKTLSEQLHGNTTTLPNAVTLIWALLAWSRCRGERLLGHFQVRTGSLIAPGWRIVVAQPHNCGTITVTAMSDDVRSPDIGILKQFS